MAAESPFPPGAATTMGPFILHTRAGRRSFFFNVLTFQLFIPRAYYRQLWTQR